MGYVPVTIQFTVVSLYSSSKISLCQIDIYVTLNVKQGSWMELNLHSILINFHNVFL